MIRSKSLSALAVALLTAYPLIISNHVAAQQNSASSTGRSGPVQAAMADTVADAIGVNTHLGYDTYAPVWNTIIRPRLLESGIRHIRDWLTNNQTVNSEYRDLAAHGVTGLLLNFENDPNLRDTVKNYLNSAPTPFVDSVEPPNESDTGKPEIWVPRLLRYQKGLWEGYQSDPALKNIWVLGPSFANTRDSAAVFHAGAPDAVNFMDHGNLHDYPGGEWPEGPYGGGWGIPLDRSVSVYRAITGDLPLVSSETGYHNAKGHFGHPGVSERAAARYMPRLVLEHLRRGFLRTYMYEFFDEGVDSSDIEKNFGLLHHDGTPKLQFTSLKNLIALFSDKGPAFKPGSLDYSLAGDTSDVYTSLFQKRDGKFYLVLLLGVDSYDTKSNVDIESPFRAITVKFNQKITSGSLYLPSFDDFKFQQHYSKPATVIVDVTDQIAVIEISTSTIRSKGKRP